MLKPNLGNIDFFFALMLQLIPDIPGSGIEIFANPECSMYGIFTNIYPKNHPNVGKHIIHGAFGNTKDPIYQGRRSLWMAQ